MSPLSGPMSEDDDAYVLSAALRVIRNAQLIEPGYAGPFSPVRTDQLSGLLARTGCHVEVFAFQSATVAMTLPRCAGVYPILLNRGAERTDRVFALRHELAHVLAGDVETALYLSDEGFMSAEERVADLFALADLVPGWWIDWVSGDAPQGELGEEVAQAIAEFAEGWTGERAIDRARLRLRLYREWEV